MADNRYSWLDGTAAEHLLRGETADALAAVGSEDEQAREQALRLAAAMTAVAELPVVVLARDGELPGEAAAMRAFRRANPEAGRAGARRRARRAAGSAAFAFPGRSRVRRRGFGGGPSFGRPLWAGLGVALSAALLGGAAIAAGTLPQPFGGEPDPVPATSVSAVGTPRGTEGDATTPSAKSSHGDGRDGESRKGKGHGSSKDHGGGPSARKHGDTGAGGPGEPQQGAPDSDSTVNADVCRKYRDGTLDEEQKRNVEDAAGGPEALDRRCDALLDGVAGNEAGTGDGDDEDEDGKGKGTENSPAPTPGETVTPSPGVSLRLGSGDLPLGS